MIDFINEVKKITLSHLKDLPYFVFLFGSRVSPYHPSRADIDIGIWGEKTLDSDIWHKIRNDFDESDIPIKVDLIDFAKTNKDFINQATQEIKIWQQPVNFPQNSPLYKKLSPHFPKH